jgi:hypothetical protein
MIVSQSDRQVDEIEQVLSWREAPCLEGIVGRTQDDCDGDWTQQLLMEAMPDGRFHVWCRYTKFHVEEDKVETVPTDRFIFPSWLEGPARLLWYALRMCQETSPQVEAPSLVPLPKLEKLFLDLLEVVPWPPGLRTEHGYVVTSQDATPVSLLVMVGPDGDAWVLVGEMYWMYRFRTSFGGGMSVAVRNALVVLAEAIRRNEEN